ncbi:hypothetical protein BKA93DRAFT_758522 [Sparassis latifolia]|uniref:Uncharacterized protein n=1 Tax=Sparassis crispa TaxID=139825 RepID=A0A401GC30_9APHY|nr:hypothetical protein SCP_0209470 [Sparassis crispa]GBE79746.1 hypothetical protein SCP_0209470 [Sparassis crispa]
MCYAYGSPDHATGVCPMCKWRKPIGTRCPHVREVCHNRALHPRHDVVYLKNAEVQTFNGCGFCKWANTNPPPKLSGYQNPGWPGCCRPPSASEQKCIGAADWPAVSVVHHVPIPPPIKAALDSAKAALDSAKADSAQAPTATKGNSSPSSPTGNSRNSSTQSLAPLIVRRQSYNPTRTDSMAPRSPPITIPVRARSGGSPQQPSMSLTGNASRNPDGDSFTSSLPNKSVTDQHQAQRRSAADIFGDKRSDASGGSQNSPVRRNAELGGSVSRRSIERRPSITAALPSMSVSKVTVDVPPPRRRGSVANPSPQPSVPRAERTSNLASLPRRNSVVAEPLATMSVSGSSSSSGSNSETTVISDGGFTDYLSDESEAELQRQAEAKAAILAQNQLEEQEFKAARQQLASVDLHPPKSWIGNVNSTPRSQASAPPSAAFPASYGSSPYGTAHSSVASSTHSRG